MMVVGSCEKSASTTVISPEVQYTSDTLVAKVKTKLIQELDSICAVNKDQRVAAAVDSLYQMELIKIDRLKND
jgi:hypothetical protein